MKILPLAFCCLFLWSCEPVMEGYDPIGQDVHFRLVQFGDGELTLGAAHFAEVQTTSRFLGKRTDDYSTQFMFQRLEPTYLGGEVLGKAICNMVAGDSARFVLPYHIMKESLLDEYSVDSIPLADTTRIELGIRVLNLWTQEQYLAEQAQDVRSGELEEDAFLEDVLQETGMRDSLEYMNGVYYRIQTDGSDSTLHYGSPLELDMVGTFLDGSEFDNSYTGKTTMSFKLGDPDQVVPGIAQVIGRMRYGDRAFVVMPSYKAFGKEGSSTGVVPARTPVCFSLEIRRLRGNPNNANGV